MNIWVRCQVPDHRLTRPRKTQTNGMVEGFNGGISEVLATHRFDSRASIEQTLKRYVHLYNQHLPQKALRRIAPIDVMKSWHTERPALFHRKPRNHPDPDTYSQSTIFYDAARKEIRCEQI